MRFWILFALIVASVVPMVAPNALEAVAQQPYWQGGGKNLLSNVKVDAVGNRVVTLSETLTQFIVCNRAGQLFDGSNCVAPGAGSLNVSCPDGSVLKGISNGNPLCVAAPAGGDGKEVAVPACTSSQTLVVRDGKLACKDDLPFVASGTVAGFCMMHNRDSSGRDTSGRLTDCGLYGPSMGFHQGVSIAPAFCGARDHYKCDCPSGFRRILMGAWVDDGGSTNSFSCLKI